MPLVGMTGLEVLSSGDEITGLSDGDSMSGWNDQSGNDFHWTLAPGFAGEPKYMASAGPDGLPCVKVGSSDLTDGVPDGVFLAGSGLMSALTANGAAEAFLVLKAPEHASNSGLWYFSGYGGSAHYRYASSDIIYESFGRNVSVGPLTPGSLTQWRLYNVSSGAPSSLSGWTVGIIDRLAATDATSRFIVRLDGTEISSTTDGSFSMDLAPGWLGQGKSFNYANLLVAEVAMFSRVLSDAERDNVVEPYFASKYGLTIA